MALAENKTMLALASKLGFAIQWDADARVYDLRMDLKSIDHQTLKCDGA